MIMLVWYVVIVFGASRGKGCLAIDCWAIPPPMWQLARARDPCTSTFNTTLFDMPAKQTQIKYKVTRLLNRVHVCGRTRCQ